MEPETAQLTTPALSEYQTPSIGASASTLAPLPTTERADKSEPTPELPRKDRRASPSPRSSPKERHRSRTRRESEYDDDGHGREATAPRRKAQSMPSTKKSRASSKSRGSMPRRARERLQWNVLDDSITEEKGSSTDGEQTVRPSQSRRSLSNRRSQLSLRAESSSSSSSESGIHEHAKPKHSLKPPKYDGTGSFETFLAQFRNCALYNKWTKKEQRVYLRSSLEKDAGQVFWDYSAETNTTYHVYLCGTNIAGSFFSSNVLFACLQCKSIADPSVSIPTMHV